MRSIGPTSSRVIADRAYAVSHQNQGPKGPWCSCTTNEVHTSRREAAKSLGDAPRDGLLACACAQVCSPVRAAVREPRADDGRPRGPRQARPGNLHQGQQHQEVDRRQAACGFVSFSHVLFPFPVAYVLLRLSVCYAPDRGTNPTFAPQVCSLVFPFCFRRHHPSSCATAHRSHHAHRSRGTRRTAASPSSPRRT